ncbi:MAG TPA: bifunctional serine/threonine-protein kinase/formylglycine-generating enzyme family protein [Planctomycetota bacterium]|jgi:formylglycine-generating enzyme required for sulfatase activity|nr:bifunctional serine/threonine-protein kinase/formylglycine-generating enzyme family protein [Planctomycetota bacterium]
MDPAQSDRAVLFDFVAQWMDDRRRQIRHPLSHYLARFPEQEELVASEFARLSRETPLLGEPDARRAGAGVPADRYERLQEIARGGMGRILLVRDRTMNRRLAMKVARGSSRAARERLVEEGRVTGELDHPGVVPVHDAGVDEAGQPFFTMRFVEGLDLREIIVKVHERRNAWTRARALEVLLKVCDTVAFAHSRGVVHRDLKAANIRVGSYGEVYVLDWGLAKAPKSQDHEGSGSPALVPDSASSGLTRDGDVIGTPCTMSPEQAAGSPGAIGPRSDVYSVGAMLYELLCGRMPYVERGEQVPASDVVARVLAGPPAALHRLDAELPGELVAICEKAMARDPSDRYADMREMAADLRAYLESRVVQAYRTGASARIAKWVARNRWLSVAILAAVVIAISASAAIVTLQRRSQRRLQLVADRGNPKTLLERFDEIRPDGPGQVAAMEAWLAEARDLESRRDAYARELKSLQARARPYDANAPKEAEARREHAHKIEVFERLIRIYRSEEERMKREGGLSEEDLTLDEVRARIKSLGERLAELSSTSPGRLTWEFEDANDQFRHDALAEFLPALAALSDRSSGESLVTRMQTRLDAAREIESATLLQPARLWDLAIASIRNVSECPLYHGLSIRPQLGLIPIHRDPGSGLWEFLHWESGSAPAVGANGSIVPGIEMGIVLVLLPGGKFRYGAQREDPEQPNYDPQAEPAEWSTRLQRPTTIRATLAPFFISKYEMTQAQWRRVAGDNPSEWTAKTASAHVHSELHPVERVDWNTAMRTVAQVGLALPTEAQWEYAARGGTTTPWWTGSERESLRGAVNLADRSARAGFAAPSDSDDWSDLDDGFAAHAPVGSFRGNPFGLHDVCGNVAEWCRDRGDTSYNNAIDVYVDTFERWALDEGVRVLRGGCCSSRASACRSSARAFSGATRAAPDTGLRPSRELDP